MNKRIKIEDLINAILDNQNENDEKLVKAVETVIANSFPYNHRLEDPKEATGTQNLTTARVKEIGTKEINTLSEECEFLEEEFTKRELAMMLAGSRLVHEKIEKEKEELMSFIMSELKDMIK